MKKVLIPVCLVLAVSAMQAAFTTLAGQQLTAKEIVKKTDDKFNGEMSGYSVMSMTIVRPTWQRTIEFKSWALDNDYALTLITAPAREKGQTFMKRGSEMWSWNPAINDVTGMDGLRLHK